MPIDTSIYDQLKPPVFLTPVQKMSQMYALQNAQQQSQLGAQQVQQGQMNLNDQQAIRKAITDSSGDMDQVVPLAAKYGASGNALMSIQKGLIGQKQALAQLNESQLNIQKTKNDAIAGVIDGLPKDPQALQAALPNAVGSLVQRGYLSPQEAQQITPQHLAQMGNGDPSAGLQFYRNTLMGHGQLMKEALEKQTADAATTKSGAAMSEANTKATIAPSEIAKNAATTSVQNLTASGKLPMTDKDRAEIAAKRYEAGAAYMNANINALKNAREQREFDLTYGGAGAAPQAPGAPAGQPAASGQPAAPAGPLASIAASVPQNSPLRAQARTIAMYDAPGPSSRNSLDPKNALMLALVNDEGRKADPNYQYDATKYGARQALETSNTAGPLADKNNSIRTAATHLTTLKAASDALNNKNITVLNEIANQYGLRTGQSAPAVFQSIVHRVGPEVASAYVQGGGGEGERGQIMDDFNRSASKGQINGVLGATAQLLDGKLQSNRFQYESGKGMKPGTSPDPLGPMRGDFERIKGLAPGATVKMKAPNGDIRNVPASQVDHYKQKGAVIAQ